MPQKNHKRRFLRHLREKKVAGPNTESGPSKKTVPKEEADEFLKLIKMSDYNLVYQLSQTLSKISMFSLLLSSEAHKEYILKTMNEAHVTKVIIIDQFDRW